MFIRSILNREYIFMYMAWTLAAVLSICRLHVIILLKMTPKSFTPFTNGMFLPFSCSTFSGALSHLEKSFIELYVPALTPRYLCSEAALQFAENTTFVLLRRVYRGIVHEEGKMNSRCRGDIVYIWTVQYWGKDRALRLPCRYFFGCKNSPSMKTKYFASEKSI